ncbi:MAG TPA: hypothetical protein VGL61_19845 [Kofleriaceae bacterium]|nr:hypothetical protein [Gemmatimonadaceae bacterium]
MLTAAICLPLGALTQRQASAQPRLNGVGLNASVPAGASHFEAAQLAMHTAWNEINASQRADEDVWHDDAGHGAKAMDLIAHALQATDKAAAWAQLDAFNAGPVTVEVRHRRAIVRQRSTP